MSVTTGRRHYQHIAQVLHHARTSGGDETTIDIIAGQLADAFKQENSGFSYANWYAAVGIPAPERHQTNGSRP